MMGVGDTLSSYGGGTPPVMAVAVPHPVMVVWGAPSGHGGEGYHIQSWWLEGTPSSHGGVKAAKVPSCIVHDNTLPNTHSTLP